MTLPIVAGVRRILTFRHSWIGLLVVVGLVYGAWLNRPETGRLEDGKMLYSYDENYTVLTARRIALGDKNVWDAWRHPDDGADRRFTSIFSKADLGNDDSRYEWVHPPTPRLLMAAIITVAGMNAMYYRIPSLLLGMLIVAMTWVIGDRMRGPAFGLCAATLTAVDGWLFCLSRVAMTDIYFIAATITAYAAFYVYWTTKNRRLFWIVIVGALCGVDLAMKWSAVAPILGLAGMTVARLALDWRRSAETRPQTLREAGVALASFVVLPPLIYFASFWPFFVAGHSLDEWVQMHKAILAYNVGAPHTAPGSSVWYQWPLDRRYTWFLTRAKDNLCQYTFASSNWIVWFPFVPALCYAGEQFTGDFKFERGFVLVGACVTWLPYALVHRFVFTRYFAATVPFCALAITAALFDLRAMWPRVGRLVQSLYLAAAIVFFVLRYPLWSGVPMPCSNIDGASFFSWLHAGKRSS